MELVARQRRGIQIAHSAQFTVRIQNAFCWLPTDNGLPLTACRLLPSDSHLLDLQFLPLTRAQKYGSLR